MSRIFPGYFLARHPDRIVGLTSYGQILATMHAGGARDYHLQVGLPLNQDATSAVDWLTPSGGGMWAAGAGGSLTGRGYHLGIVDDPVKGHEDADLERQREALIEWYQWVWYPRAEPGAALVIIQTRWHESDLVGWLMEREPKARQEWHVVTLPAIAEDEAKELPETSTRDEDWREPGEALCPERYDLEELDRIRRTIGKRAWAPLYQQRPAPREGSFFRC